MRALAKEYSGISLFCATRSLLLLTLENFSEKNRDRVSSLYGMRRESYDRNNIFPSIRNCGSLR